MQNLTEQRIPIEIQDAAYIEQELPEYRGNPLIEALPPILSQAETIGMLAQNPSFDVSELSLGREVRMYCTMRLKDFYQPLGVHLRLEFMLSCAIRQGYLSRNPLRDDHYEMISNGFRDLTDKESGTRTYWAPRYLPESTASGFSIIGVSGIGKTSAIRKILKHYPQTIRHTRYNGKPLCITQLTYVQLECPFDGSVKGICIKFFEEIDYILGTDYTQMTSRGRGATVDKLMIWMAQVARNHSIGVLIIDEIQHLVEGKGNSAAVMLNFFVNLVNTLGIPIILIGTNAAEPILRSEFRQARRGTGQGDLFWPRMEQDAWWTLFMRALWKFQWVRHPVPLTQGIENAMYHESQGIIDIVMKVFMLSQITAISDKTETVDEGTIHRTGALCLQGVQPMLIALRTNDNEAIARYRDIRPVEVEPIIDGMLEAEKAESGKPPSLKDRAVDRLLLLFIGRTEATEAVKTVLLGNPNIHFENLVRKAFQMASGMIVPPMDNTPEKTSNPPDSLASSTSVNDEF